MQDVAGLVLAAGASSRMGSPKALLRLEEGGPTFVEIVVDLLRAGGIAPIVVVTRAELADALAPLLGERARIVVNPRPEQGMQSSVMCGLEALGDGPLGVMLALVDQPAVLAGTVGQLVARFRQSPESIVVPRSPEGRRGHPVIFPRRLLAALREPRPDGVRTVLWENAAAVVEAETADGGPFLNVNTPRDLAALRGPSPPEQGKRGERP